ncbi:PAC2 family protein [Micrococcus cohnii]|uniref:PAC2 family protein n=1 Tax=Micrococcus cohnii TaxID=993416 RepID=A0A7W7M394_9MICC|nr:PAC2 family protein [Micrococcus cohnii]MBB4735405.1 hypothetical protein [Micrococcus cohnii]
MSEQQRLFTLAPEIRSGAAPVPEGLDLFVVLSGHMDAGRTASQVRTAVRERLERRVIAEFDVDRLIDYRDRRPRISFDGERFRDLRMPSITLELVQDPLGHPFLMLAGPEPDFAWQAFSRAVLDLAEAWRVESLVFADAVPMPVPHTRRLGVTAHGTHTAVLRGLTTWSGAATMMGGAAQVIEYGAEERGILTAGYSIHVPHYVAEAKYPPAAVAVLEYAGAAMGRMLPADELRDAVREVEAELDRQTGESPEIQTMISGLERNYDQNAGGQERSLLETSHGLPDGEELASAVEAYLSRRQFDD